MWDNYITSNLEILLMLGAVTNSKPPYRVTSALQHGKEKQSHAQEGVPRGLLARLIFRGQIPASSYIDQRYSPRTGGVLSLLKAKAAFMCVWARREALAD
jgi:hypothetical protein